MLLLIFETHFLLLTFGLARDDIVVSRVLVVNSVSFIGLSFRNVITNVTDVVNGGTFFTIIQAHLLAFSQVLSILHQISIGIMTFVFYLFKSTK